MALATILIALVNVLVFLAQLDGMVPAETYGLVPAQFVMTGEIFPLFTSQFLHDPRSFWHIGGNLLILCALGPCVEEALGSLKFLAVYALAGALGCLLHVAVDTSSFTPLVGASGALFGVMAVASVVRPRMFVFVAVMVAINVWNSVHPDESGVSFAAHIGGFCAGVLLMVFSRSQIAEAS